MTGNEYQKLAARTINQGLTFEEQKIHALYWVKCCYPYHSQC